MKNFPHQINDIPKLVKALGLYQELLTNGSDVSDDGVFGYAMARALIYTFRNQKDVSPTAISARIEQEKQKIGQNQGARTAARDVRRFFELANFIDDKGVTQIGKNIIDAGDKITDPVVQHLWHNAMLNITLGESHPYQVLLNIIRERPRISRDKLALALEAENDSAVELQRILQIADSQNWSGLIDCSEAQRRNAVKILPAIAKQIGDITKTGQVRQKKTIVNPDASRKKNEEIEEYNLYSQDDLCQGEPTTFSYSGKPKAKQAVITKGQQKCYPRDRMVAVNALVHANHKCEIKSGHKTFTRRSNNKPYMEPHHLIPLAFSDNFDVSLDVEENVVCLCSTCHNCIHYGKEAADLVAMLYNQRKELLQQVGIEVTLEEVLSMY